MKARSFLWLGPLTDESTMLARTAVSPAANRWQTDLLSALHRPDRTVQLLAYIPEPVWPRGPARVQRFSLGSAGWPATTVSYLNVPVLREVSLRRACLVECDRLLRLLPPPEALITYNLRPAYAAVGMRAQSKYRIPWVVVVADVPDNARAARQHHASLKRAAGRVYLSWSAYSCAPRGSPRLHLDGGVRCLPNGDTPPPEPVLLYSGTLSAYGGVDLLLASFRLLQGPDLRLWVCGKGTSASLAAAVHQDPRITAFGVLPEEELGRLSRAASVFVNPRPGSLKASQNNFPSKVLEYLSYGKPVVSTWTPGLAPAYRDVLLVPEAETPDALAKCLQHALAMSPQDREALQRRIIYFLGPKLWTAQVSRLVSWIHNEVRA